MSKIIEKILEPSVIYTGSSFKLKVKVKKGLTFEEVKTITFEQLQQYTFAQLKGD